VLLPTIAAAVALEPAHETWVLDDGDRPDVELLARRLGAHYLRRPTHEHAKAGNLNHALATVDAEFVAVLDADHVALPGLLTHTLPFFGDPRVAVVQTPQDFYNLESFEHERRRSAFRRHQPSRFSEQALFYRVIQPGKNRWQAAFWCGTNAVARVEALREVGGVATETLTEDIHTTIRLHRRGWRTVYLNEVLARGLAATDADQYAAQRFRWGTGAMQVLRIENPMVVPGLTLHQRVSYAETLLGWFESWRSLGYLLLPIVVLATGAAPIRVAFRTFLAVFAITYVLQRLALQRLGRGQAPAVLSTVFDVVRMEANLKATLTLVTRRSAAFRVTPKGRVADERRRPHVPVVLDAVLALTVAAAVWFVASAAGLTPLHYGTPWATYGAAFWLLVNAALVAAAALRIRDARFAGERRAAVRFDVDVHGHVGDAPVLVTDLSLTGAQLVGAGALFAGTASARLRVTVGGEQLSLAVTARSSRAGPVPGSTLYGVAFADGQDDVRARLALALFHTGAVPVLTPVMPSPGELAPLLGVPGTAA